MNLVDSSGWVHYFQNGLLAERYTEFISKPYSVITPTIVIFEVYKKLRQVSDPDSAMEAASQMRRSHVILLSDEIALDAADHSINYHLAMADAIIYATARAYSAKLITSDADFKTLPNVTYISMEEEK